MSFAMLGYTCLCPDPTPHPWGAYGPALGPGFCSPAPWAWPAGAMGERRWWDGGGLGWDEARASRVGCPEKGRRRWSCLSRGWILKRSPCTLCAHPTKKRLVEFS